MTRTADPTEFAGKRVLVSGGTKGLGRATVDRFLAGGARVIESVQTLDIGSRNVVIARKLFWKNAVLIAAEHVGGTLPRTLYLDMTTGSTWFTSGRDRVDL